MYNSLPLPSEQEKYPPGPGHGWVTKETMLQANQTRSLQSFFLAAHQNTSTVVGITEFFCILVFHRKKIHV
jgi:hypothetical protein